MPPVASPVSIQPPNHGAPARTRAARTDSERPDAFAALLDGPNDQSSASPPPANRAANGTKSAAARPSSAPSEGSASAPEPDLVDQSESANAPQPIVQVDAAVIAPAVDPATAPFPDGDIADAATANVAAAASPAEAALPAERADPSGDASAPDAIGQPPTPEGMDIAAVVAAAPAQDAIAAVRDRIASRGDRPSLPAVPRRPMATTIDPAAGAPAGTAPDAGDEDAASSAAPVATAAPGARLADNPNTTPIAGRPDGARPTDLAARAGNAESEAHAQPSGEILLEGTAEVVRQQGEPAQPVLHPIGRREPTTLPSDGAPVPTTNDARGGDVPPAPRAPTDALHLGVAPHALDRSPVSGPVHVTTAHASATATVPIEGLAVEIAAHAQAGRNRFEIRLDPPELGRIDVRLDVDRGGHVTSRLVVERAETLELLRRDAPELERALQQAGLKTSDHGLEFSLRGQGFGGRDDGRGEDAAARLTISDAEAEPVAAPSGAYARTLGAGGGIDIRI